MEAIDQRNTETVTETETETDMNAPLSPGLTLEQAHGFCVQELLRELIRNPADLIAGPDRCGLTLHWGRVAADGVYLEFAQNVPAAFLDWVELEEIISRIRATRVHAVASAGYDMARSGRPVTLGMRRAAQG
jgi:hypothetical protein